MFQLLVLKSSKEMTILDDSLGRWKCVKSTSDLYSYQSLDISRKSILASVSELMKDGPDGWAEREREGEETDIRNI